MIKDITLYLEGTPEDENCLRQAQIIAAWGDVCLDGLLANYLPDLAAFTAMEGVYYPQNLVEEAMAEGTRRHAALVQRLARTGLPHSLKRLDLYPAIAGETMANHARLTDLIVLSRPGDFMSISRSVAEAALFETGRPCLYLPVATPPRENMDVVMIGWKNTREAARALAASMPFLHRAKRVVVCHVQDRHPDIMLPGISVTEVGRHLDRHGISAEIIALPAESDPAHVLLRQADKIGAHLLVVGGYGHSRFRELILGGVTRTIFDQARMPILMAH